MPTTVAHQPGVEARSRHGGGPLRWIMAVHPRRIGILCALAALILGIGAAPAPADEGDAVALIQRVGCCGCHSVPGVRCMAGMGSGPNLSGLMGRPKIAGGTIENTPENLKLWLKDPPAMKPGTLMVKLGLSDQEIETIVAYLQTLK